MNEEREIYAEDLADSVPLPRGQGPVQITAHGDGWHDIPYIRADIVQAQFDAANARIEDLLYELKNYRAIVELKDARIAELEAKIEEWREYANRWRSETIQSEIVIQANAAAYDAEVKLELADERIAELETLTDNLRTAADAWRDAGLRAESRISEMEEAQRWIPVSERMPPAGTYIFNIEGENVDEGPKIGHMLAGGGIYFAPGWFYDKDEDFDDGESRVTHWRPFPEQPR